MQERLRTFGKSIIDRWNAFERSQKIKIIITVVVLLTTLIATILFTTRTRWTVIIDGKSWAETSKIQNALTSEGIDSKTVSNGAGIAVKDQEKDAAMLALSESQSLSGIDFKFTFEDALLASGMGSTDRIKREAFQHAFVSELATKLKLFGWVDDASVEIVFPDENRFVGREQERPTAAIWLIHNRTPDSNQAENVARMVSRSVKNLSIEDIEIVDQHAQILYSGGKSQAGTTGSEQEVRRQYELEYDARVRNVLMPIYDKIETFPRLQLNWNKSTTTSKRIESPDPDSPVGVPMQRTTESQSVTGGSTDAEPGTVPNDRTTPTYETGTEGVQSAQSKLEDVILGYNEEVTNTETSVGEVVLDGSSMAVFAYNYVHYYQKILEENDQLGGLTWDEFVDQTSRREPQPVEVAENILESLRNATGMPQLSMVAYEVPFFHSHDAPPSRLNEFIIFGILALLILLLALGMLRRSQADEIIELEPELTVEDLLVSTQLEEEKEELPELEPIGIVNESESITQINKFIDERPEVVAALLRNWLNEDWE